MKHAGTLHSVLIDNICWLLMLKQKKKISACNA